MTTSIERAVDRLAQHKPTSLTPSAPTTSNPQTESAFAVSTLPSTSISTPIALHHPAPRAASPEPVAATTPNPVRPAPTAQPMASQAARADVLQTFDVVIIGAGAAGIGVAASLLRRRPSLSMALVDPSGHHSYQPGWTLVGAGVADAARCVRPTQAVVPRRATWFKSAALQLLPTEREVLLSDGLRLRYAQLVVCPGLRLAWEQIDGLEATLGKNGVTSNYRRDLAPYTWALVQKLKSGKALFSQPPLPIKGMGAPLEALYLSCDQWRRSGVLGNIQVELNVAGPALFGVAAFVPVLMQYIARYRAKLVLHATLVKVDGPGHTAWFDVQQADGTVLRVERSFDMLHAVPPQVPPDVVRTSLLADVAGWCEVDHATLQSPKFPNVFSLGDVCSAPNVKTVAAVRKQVVLVVENLLALRDGLVLPRRYDGYSACALAVERGKVVLAEFGYGGKLQPTFPLKAVVPRRSAWWLKTRVLPRVYGALLLKGREWLTG